MSAKQLHRCGQCGKLKPAKEMTKNGGQVATRCKACFALDRSAQTADADAETVRCNRCGAEKARHLMKSNGDGKVQALCKACVNARAQVKRDAERQGSDLPRMRMDLKTPEPPDPAPAREFRALLAYARGRGVDFEDAWALCLPEEADADGCGSWRSAFLATRDAWEAAYLRQGKALALAPLEPDHSERQALELVA